MEVSDQQRNEYKAAFRLFDKDKDGLISNEELATVMRSIGHQTNQADLRELFGQSGDFTQALANSSCLVHPTQSS